MSYLLQGDIQLAITLAHDLYLTRLFNYCINPVERVKL